MSGAIPRLDYHRVELNEAGGQTQGTGHGVNKEKISLDMLNRLYADNYRCLVNFEVKFDRLNLLMGENGSGKTSLFDVLRNLQTFLAGDTRIQHAFPFRDLTRWQAGTKQRFELSMTLEQAVYDYHLSIEHTEEGRKSRVHEECLLMDGKPLFRSKLGEAILFRDDFSQGPTYPFDWTLSGVGALHARQDNTRLTRFRKAVSKWVVAGISPSQMEHESRDEAARLSPRMENFVSWFARLAHENLGAMADLFSELKKVIPGFRSFSLKDVTEDAKGLKVLFDRHDNGGRSLSFDLSELSDGQRVLIALYTLVHGLRDEGLTLFLDEPDNYVSLREIQPWLSTLSDECGESFEQAVLISHHPEIINYMGGTKGRWFHREGNGPVRVAETLPQAVAGLSLSESMARGWQA